MMSGAGRLYLFPEKSSPVGRYFLPPGNKHAGGEVAASIGHPAFPMVFAACGSIVQVLQ